MVGGDPLAALANVAANVNTRATSAAHALTALGKQYMVAAGVLVDARVCEYAEGVERCARKQVWTRRLGLAATRHTPLQRVDGSRRELPSRSWRPHINGNFLSAMRFVQLFRPTVLPAKHHVDYRIGLGGSSELTT